MIPFSRESVEMAYSAKATRVPPSSPAKRGLETLAPFLIFNKFCHCQGKGDQYETAAN